MAHINYDKWNNSIKPYDAVPQCGAVGKVGKIGQQVYWARLADARALVLDFYQGERKALGSGRGRWLLAGAAVLVAVEAAVLALLVRRY